MSKIKHLGKFTDEGDYIELPFVFEQGKYRVEIKPSGENRRDKTIYVDDSGVMKLPNYNGKKAFALGSNIFNIYKIVDGNRQRITIDTYSRWSLFLKAKTVTNGGQLLNHIRFSHTDELTLPNDFSIVFRVYRNGIIYENYEILNHKISPNYPLEEGEVFDIDYYK